MPKGVLQKIMYNQYVSYPISSYDCYLQIHIVFLIKEKDDDNWWRLQAGTQNVSLVWEYSVFKQQVSTS